MGGPVCPPWICRDQEPDAAQSEATKDGAKPVTATEADKPHRFEKGELASVGAVGFVPWENRFGLVLGIEKIGPIFYGAISPEINYTREFGDRMLAMSFGLPVRLEVFDSRGGTRFDNGGRIRKADWDEASDYARILRYLSFGSKEDHFYLDVNQFKASSVAHGLLMKRYNPNLNLNTRRVAAELDAFNDYGGFELYANDVTGPNVLGALLFMKPLSFVDKKDFRMRSFSIGFTAIADIKAPIRNKLDLADTNDDGRRYNAIQVDQSNFQPVYAAGTVLGYGVDAEVKLIDTRVVDWKTYLDVSFLQTGLPADDPLHPKWDDIPTRAVRSSGWTWGHLLRLNVGHAPVHALRLRAEYRRYDPNYLPSYFDSMYEIQRIQYFGARGPVGSDLANRTKLQSVLGRDPGGDQVNGAYFEASWRAGRGFAAAIGVEVNDQSPDQNMFVHVEVPRLGRWQFMATYHRRTQDRFADLFTLNFGQTDLFLAKTRLGISNKFALVLEALTPYGIDPESVFHSTVQVNLNAEIGFPY